MSLVIKMIQLTLSFLLLCILINHQNPYKENEKSVKESIQKYISMVKQRRSSQFSQGKLMISESIKAPRKRKIWNIILLGRQGWKREGILDRAIQACPILKSIRHSAEIEGAWASRNHWFNQPFHGWINYGILPFFSGKNSLPFFKGWSLSYSDFPRLSFLPSIANILEDKILFLDLGLITGFSPTPILAIYCCNDLPG